MKLAFINIDLALFAFEAVPAVAGVVVNFVHADGVVLAGLRVALVDVDLTVLPGEAGLTLAQVVVDHILALRPILAGLHKLTHSGFSKEC